MPQMMVKGSGATGACGARISWLSSIASDPGDSCRGGCRRRPAMFQQPNMPGKVGAPAGRATTADMTGARSRALSRLRALRDSG